MLVQENFVEQKVSLLVFGLHFPSRFVKWITSIIISFHKTLIIFYSSYNKCHSGKKDEAEKLNALQRSRKSTDSAFPLLVLVLLLSMIRSRLKAQWVKIANTSEEERSRVFMFLIKPFNLLPRLKSPSSSGKTTKWFRRYQETSNQWR